MKSGLWRQRRGQIGVNVVERIVLKEWNCRWQQIDSVNDDGVDGLIFIEKNGVPTGQIIYVQVKCNSINSRWDRFAIPLDGKKLKKNMLRWRRVVGAAIIVKVHPETLEAHWADLKSAGTSGASQIYIPTKNIFGARSREEISERCGTLHIDLLLPQVSTNSDDFRYIFGGHTIKSGARQFYRFLNQSELRFDRTGSAIRFTREGWLHLNRRARPSMTRQQSFNLLGAIPGIVGAFNEADLEFTRRNGKRGVDLATATATVIFPFRQSGIVKVVFRRRLDKSGTPNYSFHTIYEPRRTRDLAGLGGHEPEVRPIDHKDRTARRPLGG